MREEPGEYLARKICGKSNCRRQEFVPVDSGGNAAVAVARLDADNFSEASDVHIAGHSDFARKGKNEFDRCSGGKVTLDREIQAAKTNVSGLSLLLTPARLIRAYGQGKCHRKSPRRTAFNGLCHRPPGRGRSRSERT